MTSRRPMRFPVLATCALAFPGFLGGCITETGGGTPAGENAGGGASTTGSGGGPGSGGTNGGTNGAAGGGSGAAAGPATGIVPLIDRVGIDMLATAVGLNVVPLPHPVLLLQGGVLCDCLEEDLARVTLDELRARRPGALHEWRSGGKRGVEVKWKAEWRDIGFTAGALPLGSGWRSTTTYERWTSSGVGDTWVGTAKGFSFQADGRFRLAGGASTAISAFTASSTGTYEVEGYMLTLRFDDGKEQRLSAVTGSDEPGKALWLAGAAFTQ